MVFMFDFGGGTLDLTILMINEGRIQIRTSNGDKHLGGQDIDNELVKFFLDYFMTEYDIDLTKKDRAKAKLKEQSR